MIARLPADAARAILDTIARRLATVALDDPALRSLTFTVHLRSAGGWPRSVVMHAEVEDAMTGPNGAESWDACGPPRKN